jgi:transcriptional regulator with XRE-family HTH domain
MLPMTTTEHFDNSVLRQWRLQQGFTQREAAQRLGIGHGLVCAIEKGNRKLLKRHLLLMAAIAEHGDLKPWRP